MNVIYLLLYGQGMVLEGNKREHSTQIAAFLDRLRTAQPVGAPATAAR